MTTHGVETPHRLPASLSRRRMLALTGAACGARFLPASSAEAQVPTVLVGIGIDLGKKLFDMGIEYAKGAVLADVFKEPTLVDAHEWVNQAVSSIESRIAALDAKIDQRNLDDMGSELESIRIEFGHYASLRSLQERNRSYLEDCDRKSSELLVFSQRYDQAFMLSSAVLAYLMLTRFALYQLDSSPTVNAQGHITSLVPVLKSYLPRAMASRQRVIDKLAPHYRILCREVDKGGIVSVPKTQCDFLRGDATISRTEVMEWGYAADKSGTNGYSSETLKKALPELYKLPALDADWKNWQRFSRDSIDDIRSANECMVRMYRAATNTDCERLYNSLGLSILENDSSVEYKWEGSASWQRIRRFTP